MLVVMLAYTAIIVGFLAAAQSSDVHSGLLLPRDKHLPPHMSAILNHHNSSGSIFFTDSLDKAAAFFRGGKYNISGFVSFEYLATSNATEVHAQLSGFSAELMSIASSQGFLYHIHEFAVPSDGNCTGTGAHLDPTNYTEVKPCVPPQVWSQNPQLDGVLGSLNASFASLQQSLPALTNLTRGPLDVSTFVPSSSTPTASASVSASAAAAPSSTPLQKCQEGDLSGYGGKLRPDSAGAVNTSFQDVYLQWTGPASAIILGKSVVIHLPNKTRIACANITSVQMNGTINSTVFVNAIAPSNSSLSSSSGTVPTPPTSAASTTFVSPASLYLVILALLYFS